jgi:hypothetical protein
LPLFALILKPLSPVLPADFQYFGWWLLLCFLLQGFFAYRLLECVTHDRRLALAGTGFFVVAPPLLVRAGLHPSLCGQWALLAGLYLYFARRPLPLWTVLLGVTALIHGYLLLMVAAIWVADLVRRHLEGQLPVAKSVAHLAATAAVTIALMWLAGYFMVGGNYGSGGYEFFGMNLLSPFNPSADFPCLDFRAQFSRILPELPSTRGYGEGFNFLGLGMLAWWGIALAYLAMWRQAKVNVRSAWPLALIVVLPATALAISNHVTLGAREILHFDLPPLVARICGTVRGSGRMFWPVFYLLYLAPFQLVARRPGRRFALVACALLLALQAADSSPAMTYLRRGYQRTWVSPTQSPFWDAAGRVYRKVVVVRPNVAFGHDYDLGHFAVTHGMAINSAYLTRSDPIKDARRRRNLAASVMARRFAPDSLYIFRDGNALWRQAVSHAEPGDVVGIVDGYRVLAPGMAYRLKGAETRRIWESVRPDRPRPNCSLGQRIRFAEPSSQQYLADGWSSEGPWGVWSEADTASLLLSLRAPSTQEVRLVITGGAVVCARQPGLEVQVAVNGSPVGTLHYTKRMPITSILHVPQALAARGAANMLIQFRCSPGRKSLGELGLGADERRLLRVDFPFADESSNPTKLGFRLVSLLVKEGGPPP